MSIKILRQFAFAVSILFLSAGTGNATMRVVQKEISVSRELAGNVLVKGTDAPAGGVLVELCSSDWKTVLASTKTDEKGHFSLEKPGRLFYVRVIQASGFSPKCERPNRRVYQDIHPRFALRSRL
jgi:hypothetical protein